MSKYSKGDIVQLKYTSRFANANNAGEDFVILDVLFGKKYMLVRRGSGSTKGIGPIPEKDLQ